MTTKKKRVAILGATGYGGGELLRLLLTHPAADIRYVTSRSEAGTPVGKVHRNLDGICDLKFSNPDVETLKRDCDFIFGALPHGASAEVLAPFIEAGIPTLDLSGDYRLRNLEDYSRWYEREHPHPELIEHAVYACPEFNAEKLKTAKLVACPGCFATSVNLGVLPFAKAGVATGRVNVVAMTASSGSGASASAGTHHPERSQTLRPYKVLSHQHVPEIIQLAKDAGSTLEAIDFTPVSAPIVRGILAIITIPTTRVLTQDEVDQMVADVYDDAPFVKVLHDREPECASIATTNYAEFRARAMPQGGVHVSTTLDNLIKGAGGQAIQAFNLMLGLPQTTGLEWMGTWP